MTAHRLDSQPLECLHHGLSLTIIVVNSVSMSLNGPVYGKLVFPCDASLVEFFTAGLLRGTVLHRYAQDCILVRGRLLIGQ